MHATFYPLLMFFFLSHVLFIESLWYICQDPLARVSTIFVVVVVVLPILSDMNVPATGITEIGVFLLAWSWSFQSDPEQLLSDCRGWCFVESHFRAFGNTKWKISVIRGKTCPEKKNNNLGEQLVLLITFVDCAYRI